MFDNATDEHVRGEHVDGDTSGVCPVCRHQQDMDDLEALQGDAWAALARVPMMTRDDLYARLGIAS